MLGSMKSCERISDCRKTLFRYSGDQKLDARSHVRVHSTAEPSGGSTAHVEEALYAESVVTHCKEDLYSIKPPYPSKDVAEPVDYGTDEKISKGLNIPFDEVVYQDLISLSEVKMTVKPQQARKNSTRRRKCKRLDPEPNLMDYVRPSNQKQTFLYCDLWSGHMDDSEEEFENSHDFSNSSSNECDGHVNVDIMRDAVSGRKNGKRLASEVFDNVEVDELGPEKLKMLHKNYGLEAPQLKSYFDGLSLYNRMKAWKIS